LECNQHWIHSALDCTLACQQGDFSAVI
jgi:hypothetical protein